MTFSMQRVLLGVFVLCTMSLCWFLYALHSVTSVQQATTMPQSAFFQIIRSKSRVPHSASSSSMSVIESDATAWLSSHRLLLIPGSDKNHSSNSYVVRPVVDNDSSASNNNWLPPIADASFVEAAQFSAGQQRRNARAQFVQVYQQQQQVGNAADYYEQNRQKPNEFNIDYSNFNSKNSRFQFKPESIVFDTLKQNDQSTSSSCGHEPVRHIVFAKTHKCGSSTVQSILLRYADTHGLKIAFPKPRYFNYYVPFPKRFRAEAIYDWGVVVNKTNNNISQTTTTTISRTTTTQNVSPTTRIELEEKKPGITAPPERPKRAIKNSGGTNITAKNSTYQPDYNLMCFHSRFDYTESRRAMPQPDTVFITIVRDPVTQFESIYTFYRLSRVFENATFEEFIMQPERYTEAYPDNYVYRSRNPMLFDFGLDPHQMENGTAIMEKILEIERQFDLVLVADLMDESLVLLRNLLCWDWSEMVAFRKNTRMQKFRLQALGTANPTSSTLLTTTTSAVIFGSREQRAAAASSDASVASTLPVLTSAQLIITADEKLQQQRRDMDDAVVHAQKIADAVRRWNWADQMLYDHFSAKLRMLLAVAAATPQSLTTAPVYTSANSVWNIQRRVPTASSSFPPTQQQPVEIQSGIERLRRDRSAWMNACVSSELAPLKVERMFREYGGLSTSFQLRDSAYANRTCVQLALPELQYIKQLFAKQHPQTSA